MKLMLSTAKSASLLSIQVGWGCLVAIHRTMVSRLAPSKIFSLDNHWNWHWYMHVTACMGKYGKIFRLVYKHAMEWERQGKRPNFERIVDDDGRLS